jgi:hypothetical protein
LLNRILAPIRGSPHPSQNFISLYGLDDLTKSVRRVDPDTGEKINKLRKSYEGKIKELRIPGRNKAISLEDSEFGPEMLMPPEEDWHNTFVHGKEIRKGLNPELLRKAVSFTPGKLPAAEASKWENLLGFDDNVPVKAVPKEAQTRPTSTATTTTATTPNPLNRPNRLSSKRSYQDTSFSGYNETFGEDEEATDEDGGLSAGSRKRRKKVQSLPNLLMLKC